MRSKAGLSSSDSALFSYAVAKTLQTNSLRDIAFSNLRDIAFISCILNLRIASVFTLLVSLCTSDLGLLFFIWDSYYDLLSLFSGERTGLFPVSIFRTAFLMPTISRNNISYGTSIFKICAMSD